MIKAEITQIGKEAVNEEPMLILFGQTVTSGLAPYSVVQKPLTDGLIQLKKGSEMAFGDQIYQVTDIGPTANQNLNDLGHATLFFREKIDGIANGVFLTPEKLPELEVGMEITFL